MAGPQSVADLPYFVPDLKTIEEVVEYLSYYIHIDGAFIVRTSVRSKDKLTLSVCHKNTVKHLAISQKNGKYYLARTRFDSVQELVDYYKNQDVPNVEKVAGVRLKIPITPGMSEEYENVAFFPQSPPKDERSRGQSFDCGNGYKKQGRSYLQMAMSPSSNVPKTRSKSASISPVGSPSNSPGANPNRPPVNELLALNLGSTSDKQNRTSPRTKAKLPGRESDRNGRDLPNHIHLRPPPAIPHEFPDSLQNEIDNIRQSPEYFARLYDEVRNVDIDHAQDLIEQLKYSEKCECGLYVSDAQLPEGWTVHRVMESDRKSDMPHVFFVTPENESSWTLPKEIKRLLNLKQKRVLELLGVQGLSK